MIEIVWHFNLLWLSAYHKLRKPVDGSDRCLLSTSTKCCYSSLVHYSWFSPLDRCLGWLLVVAWFFTATSWSVCTTIWFKYLRFNTGECVWEEIVRVSNLEGCTDLFPFISSNVCEFVRDIDFVLRGQRLECLHTLMTYTLTSQLKQLTRLQLKLTWLFRDARWSWSLAGLSTSDFIVDLTLIYLLSNALRDLLGKLTTYLHDRSLQLFCRVLLNDRLLLTESEIAELWYTVSPWNLIGLFLVFGLLIELIDVDYIFLYEILFSLISTSIARSDQLTNRLLKIVNLWIRWKSDLPLTVIFFLTFSSWRGVWTAFLIFCRACLFGANQRTLCTLPIHFIWACAVID